MLSLKLYKYSKKPNSTKVPSGSGSNVVTLSSVLLVEGTSIQNPIFHLTTGPATLKDYSRFNYAYCSNFARYYKIEETTWYPDGWRIRCSTDLLASLRMVIGGSVQYIARSSYAQDGNIADTLWPLKADTEISRKWTVGNVWNATYGGTYIIGVVSHSLPQFGSMNYYMMDLTNLQTVITYLFSTAVSTVNNFSAADGSWELQKAMIDPLQYIKSCQYIPVVLTDLSGLGVSVSNVDIWDWSIPATAYRISRYSPNYTRTLNETLPDHPQAADRGVYMNSEPYSIHEVYFPPFGTVHLDTSITATHPYLTFTYGCDLITGTGELFIYAQTDANATDRYQIAQIDAQVGVPIQLAQATTNTLGAAAGIVGAVAQAVTGDIAGAVTTGIGSVRSAVYPHVTSIGSAGSFLNIPHNANIYSVFYKAAQDYKNYFGRPLMGPGRPLDYAGYLQTINATLSTGTGGFLASEIETVCEIMNGGFYYE